MARSAAFAAGLGVRTVVVRPSASADVPVLADLTAARRDAALPDHAVHADDPATLFYTSGSTGHPKGVLSTHRNVLSALLSWELDARVARRLSDRPPARPDGQAAALLGIPLFHVTGSHAVYLQSYRGAAQARVDVQVGSGGRGRDHRPRADLDVPGSGGVDRRPRAGRPRLGSRSLVAADRRWWRRAPRAPEQVAAIGSSFGRAKPNTGWGMTETNAIGTGIGEDDYLTRPESSGRVSAVLDITVIDESGAELPAGEAGELLVRGTSVFRGYWNRPEVDAEVFVDGWFRSGDVAYLDDEGYLFIVDRIKDLIIRGGENIGCGQVEAALLLHPAVHEAAVYALPDERLGEEVGATVYADPPVGPEDLRAFVRDHLAVFEVPREIVVASEPLPRTASGKIVKREVQAAAVAWR